MSNISTISAFTKGGSAMNSPINSSQNGPSEDNLKEAISLEELVGSECYISPEMITQRTFTYSSDIWALGIMLYQFFVGKVPFKGKN